MVSRHPAARTAHPWLTASVLAAGLLAPLAAAALDSQAAGLVETLPAALRSVTDCGRWHAGPDDGRFRIVVADVDDGAGSELYVQQLRDPTPTRPAAVLRTLPIRELNDDHSQYEIHAVHCVAGPRSPGLSADIDAFFEHDDTPRLHAWHLAVGADGRYVLVARARR